MLHGLLGETVSEGHRKQFYVSWQEQTVLVSQSMYHSRGFVLLYTDGILQSGVEGSLGLLEPFVGQGLSFVLQPW